MNFVSPQTHSPTHTQCWDRRGLYASNSTEHCTGKELERGDSHYRSQLFAAAYTECTSAQDMVVRHFSPISSSLAWSHC